MLKLLRDFLTNKKQPPPSANGSFIGWDETISRRQKLYETSKEISNDYHQIQDEIHLNLSKDNLPLFKNVFVGSVSRPKKENGADRFSDQEKFIYLIQTASDEQIGPVFYESRIFNSFEEAENDRWVLKAKIQSTTIQEIKRQEQVKESQTNPYYNFNLAKQLYTSGAFNGDELKSHLTLASTKDISPNSQAWTYKVLGILLLEENNSIEARNCFQKALNLNPNIGVNRLIKKCESN